MTVSRGFWRLALAVLLAGAQIAAVGPLHAAEDAAEVGERLRETRQQLERAQAGLQTVTGRIADGRAELRAVDARLVAAERELAGLRQRHADAQAVLREAVSETARVTHRLEVETRRLERAQAKLRRHENLFDARIAATYKYGTVSYADALVGSHDFTDFLNNVHYVRSALDQDKVLIAEVTDLVHEIADRRAEVRALRAEARRRESQAREARDEVRQLTEAQAKVTEQLQADRARHQELVERLEANRSEYSALVASLEEESASLEEELRRARWTAGTAPTAGELLWPTTGRPGSGFGPRKHPIFGSTRLHAGIDISGPTGQQIVAAADGVVVHAGWRGGYGLTVVVDHGGGLATLYAHQSRVAVTAGETVSAGQVIGYVGSTGYSTGPHLHFEVRVNGVPQDPMNWY